jgi:hypothetical protein
MYSARPTLALIVVFAVIGFIAGFGSAQFRMPGYESLGSVVSAVAISFATFAWYASDSANRSYPRSRIGNIAFVGLTIFVLPYYLLRSRGIWGGLRAVGGAILIYLLYIISMLLGVFFVGALRI